MDLLLILAVIFLPVMASLYVKINYGNYSAKPSSNKISGFDVARKILDENGLEDILIVEIKGNLTDHYDSSRKVLRLSTKIFHDETIASVAVAAHEAGHAIQDKEGYFYLKSRSFIFPIVKFCSSISYIVILIGFFAEMTNLIYLGIALVGAGLIFQLVTLPVEFNASKKAKECLTKYKLVNKSEIDGVNNMLNAAAITYVAGVLATGLQMLRLILMAGSRRD